MPGPRGELPHPGGGQTVLAAMIPAEQSDAAEAYAEKTKQIYQEMKEAHPWDD